MGAGLAVHATRHILAVLVLATVTPAGAVPGACDHDRWLADPGITPAVLTANGYRVATRQTVSLADGRQAIETVMVHGERVARCRVVYDRDGAAAGRTCYLPCRDG